ncbi:hypothetical protein [Oerskovia jenensis]|uniref:hypothetical protein n=1 Tax=Oerskovia jenensis TaxID=162169 RepID=UPI0036D9EB12
MTLPPVGDRAVTEDLMARLKRHYIKPGAPLPGGVFLPEVGWNGGGTSRADALYVGFTGSSGRLLVGHEVKASRADWLNELAKPGKADAWADQCHEWWLVTVPGVVRDGELPEGWGLMLPGRSRTRMDIRTRARRHPDRVPSWDATRSIIARQDTLRAAAIEDGRRAAHEQARADADARLETQLEHRMRAVPDVATLQAELDLIHQALGVGRVVQDPDGSRRIWRAAQQCTALDLADVAALLRDHGNLHDATMALAGRYSVRDLQVLRNALDEVEEARERVLAALPAGDAS